MRKLPRKALGTVFENPGARKVAQAMRKSCVSESMGAERLRKRRASFFQISRKQSGRCLKVDFSRNPFESLTDRFEVLRSVPFCIYLFKCSISFNFLLIPFLFLDLFYLFFDFFITCWLNSFLLIKFCHLCFDDFFCVSSA